MKFNGILRKGIIFKLINVQELNIISTSPASFKEWDLCGTPLSNILKFFSRNIKVHFIINKTLYSGGCIIDEINTDGNIHLVGSGKLSRKKLRLFNK